MTKQTKKLIQCLEQIIGEYSLNILLAGFLQASQKVLAGRGELEIRSLKLTINDFFEYELLPPAPENEEKEGSAGGC